MIIKRRINMVIKLIMNFLKSINSILYIKTKDIETVPGMKNDMRRRSRYKFIQGINLCNAPEQMKELLKRYTTTNTQTQARCQSLTGSTQIWGPKKKKLLISFFPSPKLLRFGGRCEQF
jgi:hypothetical protein